MINTTFTPPSTNNPVNQLRDYFISPALVCGPGRAAIKNGAIPIVKIPLAAESRSREGKLPVFIKASELRKALAENLKRLMSEDLPGIVFVGEDSPTGHSACMLRTWAFWAELAYVCHQLSSSSTTHNRPVTPEEMQQRALDIVRSNSNQDNIPFTLDGKTRNLLLTAMSPYYYQYEGKAHPRFAPCFCIAAVTREAVEALGESADAISKKIMSRSFKRAAVPYNNLLGYLLPERPEHLHPFAKRALRNILPLLQEICPKFLETSMITFLRAFAIKMIEVGPKTPYGEDTDEIVLAQLVREGILPEKIFKHLLHRSRALELNGRNGVDKKDTGSRLSECPFGFSD